MTIAKNTNKAKQIVANAKDIRCYSLENGFSGKPMTSGPALLTEELNSFRVKLVAGENGFYTINVHSNLWYTFRSQLEIIGFCNCCGKNVPLLTDEELGESICKICHSYDVTRNAHVAEPFRSIVDRFSNAQ
jgi:hypothetical protein